MMPPRSAWSELVGLALKYDLPVRGFGAHEITHMLARNKHVSEQDRGALAEICKKHEIPLGEVNGKTRFNRHNRFYRA